MASFRRPYSSPSPVLVVSPQAAHQSTLDLAGYSHESEDSGHSSMTSAPKRLAFQTRPVYSSSYTAGRKRSRDEAAINLNDDESALLPIESIKESEEDWIYGEGMVLVKPNSGYVADASSQSGTWVEEKDAENEAQRIAKNLLEQQRQDRPSLRSHKSQRLEQSGVSSLIRDPEGSQGFGSPLTFPTPSSESPSQPFVDDFTLHLGIGWRKISDDEHIQAAARGWAKFIENHYPLSSVQILLESKGLQSYLVEAAQGYFLLSENLKQARLVSATASAALTNLKSSPPIFEGSVTVIAAESPRGTMSNVHAQPNSVMIEAQALLYNDMDMS